MAFAAPHLAVTLSILMLLAGSALAPAAAQQPVGGAKRALLIANGNYSAPDWHSSVPGKNAQSLADELRRAGFDVDLLEDVGRAALRRAVLGFAQKIERGDIVLFFFSGHGIQAKGMNFVAPADADIWTEQDVAAQSVALGEITNTLAAPGPRALLVILDASRRNPFERRFRTLSTGLGPIVMPAASLAISAAGSGELVDDGAGETSIFVSELLKEMRSPDLTVREIFSRTRVGVARATNGGQRPLVVSALAEDVYFGPSREAAGLEKPAAGAKPAVGTPSGEPMPGLVFRDCDRCPDIVAIAPGEFDMGSDEFETEKPVHHTAITKPFAMGRSEVTFAQWDACVADGGCSYRPSDQDQARPNLPVGAVSWHDAVAYVEWLTRHTGHKYRLPTEAEWEYAARAGTSSAYWWGDDAHAGFANCRGCTADGGRRVLPVGSFPPNPFGLLDTAGNVAEWVADCWTDSYRAAPGDSGVCKQRLVRGGSFDAGPRYVRSASRFPHDPDLRYYLNGLRVLRELP